MKSRIAIILLTLMAVSCVPGEVWAPAPVGNVNVSIGLNVPFTTLPKVITRSGQNPAETSITKVQVLVFENDTFAYKVSGSSISINATGASFDAKLVSTSNPVTLYIIANSDAVIDADPPAVGDNLAQVQAKIKSTVNGGGMTGAGMMMWGSANLTSGIDATIQNTISNVQMLRTAARFDIVCNNVAANFQLVSIQAFRVASSAQIIPSHYPITTPTVPIGTQYNVNTDPITVSTPNSIAQLYLPEAEAPSDPTTATCIVVGGYYNGSSTISYYRLDINPQLAGNPVGQILRNTRYEFDIRYITNDGFSTAEEAANNPSDAIVVGMVLWKDNINYTVFDNSNYFGLSAIQVRLDGDAASSIDIAVETDYPDYVMNWADKTQTPDGSTPTQSLDDGVISVTKSAADKLTMAALAANPDTTKSIIRYVVFQANNLRMFLTIVQLPSTSIEPEIPPGPGGIIWAPGNVDEPGTFAPIGELGQIYQWGRDMGWAATGSVTGWNQTPESGIEWSTAKDPCPSGWRVPTNQELNALVKGSIGHKWIFAGGDYSVPGVWIAEAQADADNATLGMPGSAVFFPAGGHRSSSGSLMDVGSNCYYWASDMLWDNPSWFLGANGTYAVYNSNSKSEGAFIRCVKQ